MLDGTVTVVLPERLGGALFALPKFHWYSGARVGFGDSIGANPLGSDVAEEAHFRLGLVPRDGAQHGDGRAIQRVIPVDA